MTYTCLNCPRETSTGALALNWWNNRFRGTGTSNAQSITVFSIALSTKVIRG
ncbi:hypothetical protein [Mycobacteroides abscessus]|uniref:hypothetical protein n=1 Tax=Mycobacteroides abscessus TaxID=36809 RepID=UPI000AEA219A|nr:hypothetical protein [Mycobacteroides abscessus]